MRGIQGNTIKERKEKKITFYLYSKYCCAIDSGDKCCSEDIYPNIRQYMGKPR